MLSCTVNHRISFRTDSLPKAKMLASKYANKNCKGSDWLRVYVSSGYVEAEGTRYPTGSELRLCRFNRMKPDWKAGQWTVWQINDPQ